MKNSIKIVLFLIWTCLIFSGSLFLPLPETDGMAIIITTAWVGLIPVLMLFPEKEQEKKNGS